MVTDKQIRKLMKLIKTEKNKSLASTKAGMDDKTARKYIRTGRLPSQSRVDHTWKTREDPFEEVWVEVCDYLENNIQNKYPGKYSDGQSLPPA